MAVAPGGNPVADMVTRLLNAPPMGGKLSGIAAAPPCDTVKEVVAAVTSNPGVISKPTVGEVDVANAGMPE